MTNFIDRAREVRNRINEHADDLVDIDPIALRDLAYEASDAIRDVLALVENQDNA